MARDFALSRNFLDSPVWKRLMETVFAQSVFSFHTSVLRIGESLITREVIRQFDVSD